MLNLICALGLSTGLIAYSSKARGLAQFSTVEGQSLMLSASVLGTSLCCVFWPVRLGALIRLYFGGFLFLEWMLFDLLKLIRKANAKESWNPVAESLDIYVDSMLLFSRLIDTYLSSLGEE